jgi:hypothetical protein
LHRQQSRPIVADSWGFSARRRAAPTSLTGMDLPWIPIHPGLYQPRRSITTPGIPKRPTSFRGSGLLAHPSLPHGARERTSLEFPR